MRSLLLFLGVLALSLTGCKSIKRTKELQSVSVMQSASKMAVDSSVFVLAEVVS